MVSLHSPTNTPTNNFPRTGKDYGEFRNFVSVSQLKPTSGREVSNLFSGASGSISSSSGASAKGKKVHGGQATMGGFDDLIQRRNSTASMTELDKNSHPLSFDKMKNSKSRGGTHTAKTSREAYDFLGKWKQHCTTPKDTLSFLTRIEDTNDNKLILEPDAICKEYFSTDIDSEILGDIVGALDLLVHIKNGDSPLAGSNENRSNFAESTDNPQEYFPLSSSGLNVLASSEANVFEFTRSWLKAITSCGRFGLSVSFLVPDQQLKLKDILRTLEKSSEHSIDDLLLCYNSELR